MKITEKERKKRYNKVWYAKRGFGQIWRSVPYYIDNNGWNIRGEWYILGEQGFTQSTLEINKWKSYTGPMYLKDAIAYASSR